MAMKKVNLDLFFLRKDKADDLLEAKQTSEENGAAVDDKSYGESDNPVDIQLFDKPCDCDNGGKEEDDVVF